MKIKDILQRDPTSPLVNQGQARIAGEEGAALNELRGELSSFVCEGQYAAGIQTILESFLRNQGKTSQQCAWVSGFFGSGKSHLLKMLCHLWKDTALPDGATARSLVPSMSAELLALLRELDGAGKRAGGLIAAAGSMPSGTTENVRLTILGVLLKAVGLPEQYPQARFCLWLKENDYYDEVRKALESKGRQFEQELNNLYVSGHLARAVLACDPNFATDEKRAREQIKAQFPLQTSDITADQFLTVAKQALKLAGRDGRMPCTLLILDEAQQYIGDSNDRSTTITDVAEAVAKQLDSTVIMVCAGQSALTSVPLLQKLMDRFTIRVALSDADVETVTRKVLLQKRPSAIEGVRAVLGTHAGEVSRELQGTAIGERSEDRETIVDDFPLLPARRRFWEACFRQIDAAGTQSALRSQLRIIHDALSRMADAPATSLMPANELFDALAPDMINTGVLLRELSERIREVGEKHGDLARGACGLVFLIGRLKRDAGVDTGVRATKEHIADLLVSDLAADNGKLRNEVESTLRELANNGTLMLLDDEYRLQTREGLEWDREFRNHQSRLIGDAGKVSFARDQQLYGELDRVVRAMRVQQGSAKELRQLQIHRENTPPTSDGTVIPVWVRDGWSCSQKEVEEAARGGGTDSPVIHVFIRKQDAEDLARVLVEVGAARQTLDAKGNPASDPGRDARSGMEGRLRRAESERDRLIREIVTNAKVYQGGGGEKLNPSLQDRLQDAAEDSLVRLFPRFKEADAVGWGTVVKRAREGAGNPFQPLGYNGPTEKHPVCQQVLATIGAGKTGTEVRKELRAAPYGWPQDAIDAALIALHRGQFVSATLNGAAVAAGHLDQNKIAKAEFRVEAVTLSIQDRLRLRKLYPIVGVKCGSGEEAAKAPEFLRAAIEVARAAGGDPPLPTEPSTALLDDLQRLAGNEQLAAIKDHDEALAADIEAWKAAAERAAARKPAWDTVQTLLAQAAGIDEAESIRQQLDAVRERRLLLEPTDPVAPLRQRLADLLRKAVNETATACRAAFEQGMATLAGNPIWNRVAEPLRAETLREVGLRKPDALDVSTDEKLAETLRQHSLAEMRAEVDANPARVQQAIERVARKLEPTLQSVAIERATVRNIEELDAWLARQRAAIEAKLHSGPVLLG